MLFLHIICLICLIDLLSCSKDICALWILVTYACVDAPSLQSQKKSHSSFVSGYSKVIAVYFSLRISAAKLISIFHLNIFTLSLSLSIYIWWFYAIIHIKDVGPCSHMIILTPPPFFFF